MHREVCDGQFAAARETARNREQGLHFSFERRNFKFD